MSDDLVKRLRAALERISNMPHNDTCSQELCFAFHDCDCHVGESRQALAELTGGKDE